MAAPKAKTIQERFGFMDDDLKVPLHDEILMWVDRHAAAISTLIFGLEDVPKDVSVRWEHTLTNSNGHALGWVDMLLTVRFGKNVFFLLVEAKTEIRSLGELIRQLRLYQTAQLPGVVSKWEKLAWLVVAPDTRFADKLKDQGIHFLAYDESETFAHVGHF